MTTEPNVESEEITQQRELLATYRRTLAHLIEQAAQYGGEVFAPPQTASGINEARENIKRVKETLRAWGVSVDDRPGDEKPALSRHEQPRRRRSPWLWAE